MRSDLLRVIESAYQPAHDDQQWCATVAEAARPALDGGFGVVAHAIVVAPAVRPRVGAFAENGGLGLTGQMLQDDLDAWPLDFACEGWGRSRVTTLSEMLKGQPFSREALLRTVHPLGVQDALGILAVDSLGRGFCLQALLPSLQSPSAAFRRTWSQIIMHLAAGFRLRARMLAPNAAEEAVLDMSGKLQHAEGPAQSKTAQVALRQAARAIDRARSTRHRDPSAAVEPWRCLVDARWSLVDRFDSDGRHFLIARRNPPPTLAIGELSSAQRQVAALAAQGRSNKLIAYELGLSIGTVATHLMRALRKLGMRSRTQLISEWPRLASTAKPESGDEA